MIKYINNLITNLTMATKSKLSKAEEKAVKAHKKAEKLKIEDAKKWAKYAKKKKITASFFIAPNQPVRRTSDGKAYVTPEEFWAENPTATEIHHAKD